ncbi:type I polyketide synthase [Streptomyces armeniacus]|uniref:type I polyketide synthase n=1 Tax=Streptomyces armeniacus TaxID=83291 RepID=UPI00269289DE
MLTGVGRLHVDGLSPDWGVLFAGARTVALPTYAFQRQRFWLPSSTTGADDLAAGAQDLVDARFWDWIEREDISAFVDELGIDRDASWSEAFPALSAWRRRQRDRTQADGRRYRATWKPLSGLSGGQVRLTGRWLLVVPEDHVAGQAAWQESLTHGLHAHGAALQRVECAPDLDRAELTERLRQAADGEPVAGALSLLALAEGERDSVPVGVPATGTLVQALGDAGLTAPLWALTRGAVATGRTDDAPDPAQAAVWGLGRVAALEHPDRWGGLIDLPAELDRRTLARLAAVLGGAGEDQVAVRPSGAFGRRLARTAATAATATAPAAWTPTGTVLITGGTGALGAQVARWAAGQGAEHLLLTSRRGGDAPGADALVAELTELGARRVTVAACDIADRDAVSALLALHPVNAVVHTAGVLDDGVLDALTPDRFAAVFRAKAAARHLDELTRGHELDAFVLFSSYAGMVGSAGQANYAAANAMLDALAERRAAEGLPATSLAWGPWAGDGMAADADGRLTERQQRGGVLPLAPQAALEALRGAVSGPEAAALVADIDWARFGPAFSATRPSPLLAELYDAPEAATAQHVPSSELRGRLTGLSAEEQERALLDVVRARAAAVLGYQGAEAVPADRAFRDLGVDSLIAVELRNALGVDCGVPLPATVAFDHPTPQALSRYLRDEILGTVTGTDLPAAGRAVADDDPVVIVGMSCRFPGDVRTPEDFWRLLSGGHDGIAAFPSDRGWDLEALYDPEGRREQTSVTDVGGFLRDVDGFDAGFFGVSPREALAMDPQQRLLLETSWEAFERAGIDPSGLRGSRTGVFVGTNGQDYPALLAASTEDFAGYIGTGNAASIASGRIAYTLGLEGPAVTVDTACSSSLVALHWAVQALRSGECDLALAGGVTVMSTPGAFIEFSRQGGLAPDGRCKAFADGADGTGWSEGVGIIAVERLSDARRNGHTVLATVSGSAVNQDGASNGLTAPNGPSQQRVIRAALAQAGLTPDDVDAVEAHGTGTSLGDPIEAQALLATYGRERDAEQPLWLGSVKSNLGHTQAAAGVAGVIKMVLALQHGELPQTLHADTPSSHVDWDTGAVRLLSEPVEWPARDGHVRRAGVSSFGLSGTNAHIILGQAPADDGAEAADAGDEQTPAAVPFALSARTPEALRAIAHNLLEQLRTADDDAYDVARALATTRSRFEHRAVVVGAERDELLAGLEAVAEGRPGPGVALGAAAEGKSAFVFAGQGAQRLGMGRELYEAFPVFAEAFDEVCAHFDGELERPLRDVVFGDDADALSETGFTQPALFAFEVALFRLVESWGVRPDFLVGHSIGELAAAYVAGVWSLADVCRLVAARGRLMQALPSGGAMVAVEASEGEVLPLLEGRTDRVSIAALNGPQSTVVSGAEDAVEEIAGHFRSEGRRTSRLSVSHAFHSPLMEPMLAEFRRVADSVSYEVPSAAVVSNLTGGLASADELCSPEYWVRHVREAVRFADGVTTLAEHGVQRFVEIGPDGTLTAMAQASVPAEAALVPLLRKDRPEAQALLSGLASAFVRGAHVDWTALFAGRFGRAVALPTYPFQRERYWPTVANARTSAAGTGPYGAEDAADARFWDAVESGDLASLGATLGVDESALDALVPALAAWRRSRREESTVDAWRYRVRWQPVTDLSARTSELSGRWLLLALEGEALPEGLEGLAGALGTGVETVSVPAGADRTVLADRLRGLAANDGAEPVTGVLSLLAHARDESHDGLNGCVPAGLRETVALVQALGDAELGAPLWTLTRGAVCTGRSDAAPLQAPSALWGLGRVVALEHPERWGGLVDLPAPAADGGRTVRLDDRTVARLAAVLEGASGEDQVALRASGALARRVVRAGVPEGSVREWTPGGTVLITGGTGALGAQVARWVVERGAEHVVLTSRRGSKAPGALELKNALRDAGAKVSFAACDMADHGAVARVLRKHRVDSVFHAAGVLDDEAVDALTEERIAPVLRAKVRGAQHLDELTREHELSAFVVFSSIAGVWGSGGQAAYAAANAALDALVEARRTEGLAGTSVAWGPWAEAGMAASDEAQEHLRRRGLNPLAPHSALRALERALGAGDSTLVVADVDWARFTAAFTSRRSAPLFAELPEAAGALEGVVLQDSGPALRGRLAGLTAEERDRALLDVVRQHAATVLNHTDASAVEPGRAFRDMGFDSLTAVELRGLLSAETGVALPATLVFDHPTPTAVADLLRDELFGADASAALPAALSGGVSDDPVVIVGMGCRLPGGVTGPEDLWRLVSEGGDAISGFPTDRGWDLDALFGTDGAEGTGGTARSGVSDTRSGGFLHDASGFDPVFFGISPREALAIDPQQRLLLETSWEALERTGIAPTSLRGSRTGVFVGASTSGYGSGLQEAPEGLGGHLLTGTAGSVVSGRVSYTLGLEGPAVTVDTACSSSLVALHWAAQALRQGECDLALAGGVAVIGNPGAFVEFSMQGGLAPDGRCKAFADGADGTGWSEGVGVLVVERLSDARRNGHTVLATVSGSAVNQDGASNGLTAPNGPSQQRVIRAALAQAGLTTDDVDAVEGHGTGTTLGDPIEAQALLATYGRDRDAERPLWLGSVKSNLGHTQAAAGVAGVIKMVLALRHGRLPQTLHADAPSSHVDWDAGAVRLLHEPVDWPQDDAERPRRAGVSAFGVSGTNAHVVIEQAPDDAPEEQSAAAPAPVARTDSPVIPWVVSGRTAAGLRGQAERLLAHAESHPGLDPRDIGFSLATTRAVFEHRAVVSGTDRDALLAGLSAVAEGTPAAHAVSGTVAPGGRTAFLFTGQGAQRPGMGRELYESFPVFAEAFDAVCAHFDAELDRPLRELVFTADVDSTDGALNETGYTQPALFAIEVALFRLTESWGIRADVLLGHSIGELAAAHVAGVLSLADACRLVAARGRLMQALPRGGGASQAEGSGGAMVAVEATEAEVLPLLEGREAELSLAALNGPRSTVVSGREAAVTELAAHFRTEGRRTRRLSVSHAFHSPLMDPMLDEFRTVAASVAYHPPTITVISNVTGEAATAEQLTSPDYWVRHLRHAVRFADGVRTLAAQGVTRFLELGPDGTLTAMAQGCLAADSGTDSGTDDGTDSGTGNPDAAPLLVPLLRDDRPEATALLAAVSAAFAHGVPVDWAALFDGAARRRVELPTYAFQHRHYWLEAPQSAVDATALGLIPADHPLLGAAVPMVAGRTAVLTGRLSLRAQPWLAEHRIGGAAVVPSTAFLELAVRAGDQVGCAHVRELLLEAPLVLPEQGAVQLQLRVEEPDGNGARMLGVYGRPEAAGPDAPWTRHAGGVLDPRPVRAGHDAFDFAAWPPPGAAPVETDGLYERLAGTGFGYGSTFRGLRAAWQHGDDVYAEVTLGDGESASGAGAQAGRFGLHPALLDAALHPLGLGLPAGLGAGRMLFAWNGAALYAAGATTLRVRLARTGADTVSLQAADGSGQPVLAVDSMLLRQADTARIGEAAAPAAAPQTAPKAPERRTAAQAAPDASGVVRRMAGRPEAERKRALLTAVRTQVAVVLGYDGPQDVDAARSFTDIGFTSLTAVELRNQLSAELGVTLPATMVFDHPTPAELAAHLDGELFGTGAADALARTATGAALDTDPVVIVGMSCRYPGGVTNPDDLWELVASGGDGISPFPADRGWDLNALYHADPDNPGTCYTREGGFLHDASRFDPAFFGISPREATSMDPQQRLLLEASWEALERVGMDPGAARGSRTGVFAGVTYQDYTTLLAASEESYEGYVGTGNSPSVLSGRISYVLGLEGPAVTVDTACSSSLVALHLAVQALRQGECDLALAGGVTVMSTPGSLIEFSRQRALAENGRCKPYSADADGASWAEGVGVLAVERLSDARRNGHPVLAVVKGSALNQDGSSNGLTAPNGPSQQRVIRQALASARLGTADVDVVEGHGTGTTLGDPIEAQALLATYGQDRPEGRPLWLGSLKSNVGHSQAAAGVGGVIKMVEAIRHGVLPQTLYADDPSPHVDWTTGDVQLLNTAREWPETGRPRRAGVSSFGMSGTNAHVIIEQAPDAPAPAAPAEDRDRSALPVVPVALSGRTEEALREQARRLRAHLLARPGTDLTDLGHSLAVSRTAFEHRAVLPAADREALDAQLREIADGGLVSATDAVTGLARGGEGPVLVFPGQGAQWAGMGRQLLAESPVFAENIAACEDALRPFTDWSLTAVLRGDEDAADLDRVDVVQPVLWAVMVSLAALWRSYGVQPAAVVGHSQGEIAAACVAGALSLEDGARVVALRSRAITEIAGSGGMMSVPLPADGARERLEPYGGRLSVAAVNGPSSVVVSGEAGALDELFTELTADGVQARKVSVDYGSHSAQVEAIRAQVLAALAPVRPREAELPFPSTVTGQWQDTTTLDAEYWYTSLRETVRFEEALRLLMDAGHRHFIEVSPHPVLAVGMRDTAEDRGTDAAVLGSLRREQGGLERFLLSLADAHVQGVEVDWRAVFAGSGAQTVELPTYAFQRQRYWPVLTPGAEADGAAAGPANDAEARFWETVEREDLEALAGSLELGGDAPLSEVLPALSHWRRNSQEKSTVDNWRYTVNWTPLTENTGRALSGTWLLAVPSAEAGAGAGQPLAASVGQALETHGATVRTVETTAGATREQLAERLRDAAGDETVSGVLSLLALDEEPHPELPAVPGGLAATLTLVQALGDLGVEAPLWCATSGAVAIGRSEPVSSAPQALVWGLGRVAALEHSDRWGGLVDVPAVLDARAASRLAGLLADPAGEDQTAVRASGVYGRRLARAPLGQSAPTTSWRPRGTVLVTGGTGAVGSHIARWLADLGAEHLLLTSRRGADAPGAAELTAELTERGSRVTIAACDVADRDALAALLGSVPEEHPLDAVFHVAGSLDDGVIEQLDPGRMQPVLRTKASAALHLHELTRDLDLSAFVLFSSTSGTISGPGLGNYAPGNAFLDALAFQRAAEGLPATAVAWGHWADGGMGDGAVGDRLRRYGVYDMAPELAASALLQTIEHQETWVAVTDIGWERFAPAFTAPRPSALLRDLPDAVRNLTAEGDSGDGGGDLSALRQHLAGLSGDERQDAVLNVVRSYVATVLGYPGPEAVEPSRAFSDLGFDSLSAVELRNGMNKITGLRLPATLIFDYPTCADLARLLLDEMTEPTGAAVAPEAAGTALSAGGAVLDDEPVAIVAMSCRLPGDVRTPEQFWQLLRDGGDAIGPFPEDRGWDVDSMSSGEPGTPGAVTAQLGGFLPDIDRFDAPFFGISPREAVAMDPQQRLLLEISWEAFERAGIDPYGLRGSRTGVFAGTNGNDYTHLLVAAGEDFEGYLGTGNAASVVSGRIAYTFGLEGPAMTVDTACSASLVALHLAAQALRSGECDLALAGGATIMTTPGLFLEFSRQGGLASDGRSKAFADQADGAGFAEGAGMLLVERLSDARRNGHPVLAVVRGSAVNQDGASNGLTAPNGPSQQRVIRTALAGAGLQPGDVDAVEAHGTGTTLGDPIEAQALLATYGQGRDAERPLWLGSVKSNIGHTQAAAGVAGLIKMVLALEHGVLPGTLHVDAPSSHVDWDAGNIALLTENTEWPETDRPRRAAVSSFGISGTNAHTILEEAPSAADAETADDADAPGGAAGEEAAPQQAEAGAEPLPVIPWTLSGRTRSALHSQAERLLAHAESHPGLDPRDIGLSLASGRTVFDQRAVVLGEDRDGLLAGLRALAAGEDAADVVSGAARAEGRTAVLFTGQGAQRPGMGRELYESFPVFAEAFDAVCAHFDAELDRPLRELVFAAADVDSTDGALNETGYTQPALFAVEVALFRLAESWGLKPDFLVGHSIGELAAAHVAGVLSLADACRLVAARGRLMQALPRGGAMVAVEATEAEVLPLLEGREGEVSLAAVNGPTSVVVAGAEAATLAVAEHFTAEGRRTRRLSVSHAFHSPLMDPMLAEFRAVAERVEYGAPRIPVVSNVTGELAEAAELSAPDYWVRHVRQAVRFADGVRTLAAQGVTRFLELGPDGTLTAMAQGCLDAGSGTEGTGPAPLLVPALRKDRPETAGLLAAWAGLWTSGVPLRWDAAFAGTGAHRVGLPTYAFQGQRYWPKSPAPGSGDIGSVGLGSAGHPLLGAAVALAGSDTFLFTSRLSLQTHAWVGDHAVGGTVLFPGTGYLELALRAADHVGCEQVDELTIAAPLVLPERGGVRLQLSVGAADDAGRRSMDLYSRPEDAPDEQPWLLNASGVLSPGGTAAPDDRTDAFDFAAWPPKDAAAAEVTDFYERFAEAGFAYGPVFRGLRAVWTRGDEIFAEVGLPGEHEELAPSFGLHPALLDSALHAMMFVNMAETEGGRLPFSWSGVTLRASGAAALRVRLVQAGEESISLELADTTGQPVASVDTLTLRQVSGDLINGARRTPYHDGLFQLDWTAVQLPSGTSVPEDGSWAVLAQDGDADSTADAEAFAEALRAAGIPVRVAAGLDGLDALADGGTDTVPGTVLVPCTLPSDTAADSALAGGARTATHRALARVQELLDDQRFDDARLVFVTDGAVPADGADRVAPGTAPVWGLVRAARTENPGRFTLLDADRSAGSLELLPGALAGGEPELAVRAGTVLAPRLARVATDQSLAVPEDSGAWRLDITEKGTLENLHLADGSEAERELAAGEVRIAVRAAGLNFRDVLNALDMYPGEAGALGSEGAGVITEVGPGVTGLAVGDRVMGMFFGAFGPTAVADARLLARMPHGWTFAEAAAAPIVFLTAYYALVDLGGVRREESVLVHAAAGGVGMAAVQLARHPLQRQFRTTGELPLDRGGHLPREVGQGGGGAGPPREREAVGGRHLPVDPEPYLTAAALPAADLGPDFEVKVRAGGVAGGADGADPVAWIPVQSTRGQGRRGVRRPRGAARRRTPRRCRGHAPAPARPAADAAARVRTACRRPRRGPVRGPPRRWRPAGR